MEKYINETQGLLAVVQATLSEDSLQNSVAAGEEMWEAIRQIVDKYELNVQEMLNATLACHHTILEIINEELTAKKKEMGL